MVYTYISFREVENWIIFINGLLRDYDTDAGFIPTCLDSCVTYFSLMLESFIYIHMRMFEFPKIGIIVRNRISIKSYLHRLFGKHSMWNVRLASLMTPLVIIYECLFQCKRHDIKTQIIYLYIYIRNVLTRRREYGTYLATAVAR